MTGTALALRGIHHAFGSFKALTDVTLRVGDGDIYGFLGLNGAGKTTAIRIILGLIRRRGGELQILGTDAGRRAPELFREVGVLFEDFAAPSYLSGAEHLRLHARFLGVPRAERRRAAGEWLHRVGLSARAHTKVRAYSMGMRRRLGLACALLAKPRLVILDEPTNGLDPQGIRDFRELILELNRSRGATFFLSSHILGEVEQLCGRVGIIHRGRVLLEGSVGDLTGRSKGHVRLRATPEDRALDVLRAASWCPGAARDGDSIDVEVPGDQVPRMIRELVAAGIDVHEASPASDRLEDVFHRVVEGAEAGREEAAAPRDRAPAGVS